jgi:periplasmic divalent cation tolerance protein
MADEIIVLITTASDREAEKIARSLVDGRLAACANIVPGVRSLFFWDGKTQDERETLLICKSRLPLMNKITQQVKALHSYSVPEIIALPIIAGSPDYLAWVRETTKG